MSNEQQTDPSIQALIDAFSNGLIEPIKPLVREYRLYYNDNGKIIQISDSNWNHPESGNYVVVDKNIYDNWNIYRIRNGQVELKPTGPSSVVQLIKSTSGYLVAKNNPAILLEAGELIEDIEYYDHRNY